MSDPMVNVRISGPTINITTLISVKFQLNSCDKIIA